MFEQQTETRADDLRESRYLWLPQVAGAVALTAAVTVGIPAGVSALNALTASHHGESKPEPTPTRIVAGVPVLVLAHRSEEQCQSVGQTTPELLKCAGMPGGMQVLVSQCTEDVKSIKQGGYSNSFGYDINAVPQGCYDAWVGVSAEKFRRLKDGGVTIFPGKPTKHLTDIED